MAKKKNVPAVTDAIPGKGPPSGAAAAAVVLSKLGDALPALRADLNETRQRAAKQTEARVKHLKSPAVTAAAAKDKALRSQIEQSVERLNVRHANLGAAGNARAHALSAVERTASTLLQLVAGSDG
jgi:phage-related baseplate assembly protein